MLLMKFGITVTKWKLMQFEDHGVQLVILGSTDYNDSKTVATPQLVK